MRLRTIFDDRDAMLLPQRHNAHHVCWLTGNVRHDDGARQRADQGFDLLWPGDQMVGNAVGDHRDLVLQRDRHHAAGVGESADDHLAKGFQVKRPQRHIDRRRPRTDGIGIAATQPRGELGAIGALLVAIIGREDPTLDHPGQKAIDRRLFFGANMPAVWKGVAPHGRAAVVC